jgi:hypothetical protein
LIDPLERFVGLERFVIQLENDLALLQPDRLRQRLEALDKLDAHFPELACPERRPPESQGREIQVRKIEVREIEVREIQGREVPGPQIPSPKIRSPEIRSPGMCSPEMRGPRMQEEEIDSSARAELAGRVKLIRDRLGTQNRELYEVIRDQVRRGAGAFQLLPWLELPGEYAHAASGMGFDFRDDLISGLFELEQPKQEQVDREAEMVFYQPTPARHIFNLIGLVTLAHEDVFVDIGSGLGHVPLLVAISTDARAIGIELEGAYVERARQCAERLNLARVTFFEQDARTADYSGGTVFYFYTPFSGAMLEAVLERLEHEAASRRIRICSYGPSTSRIAGQRWLRATTTPETDRITVFDSRD